MMHIRYLSINGRSAVRHFFTQSTIRSNARRTFSQLPACLPPSSSTPTRSLHSSASSIRCFALSGSSSPKPLEQRPFNLADSLSTLGNDFANARMDIEDAVESVGTTYYPSDIQSAIDSTNKTLLLYEEIQKQLGPTSNEAVKLRESWSLRLEQLKAELQQAIEAGGGEEH